MHSILTMRNWATSKRMMNLKMCQCGNREWKLLKKLVTYNEYVVS